MKNRISAFILVIIIFFLGSCVSIEDIVLRKAGEMLSSDSSGSVFTGDDDPQLIADALPLAMKLYEMILASQPDNPELNFVTGKNFILYANAFIQTPADMLPDEEWMQNKIMMMRAKKMYLRGRDYILKSLGLSYPGWEGLLNKENIEQALLLCTPEDVPRLYWAASAWIGAFSCDPLDFDMAANLHIPAALLLRGLQLDEEYGEGAIHSILIQVYASLPSVHISNALLYSPGVLTPFMEEYYRSRGLAAGNGERIQYHFETAIELSGGKNPSPFIAAAKSLAIPAQDYPYFKFLLEEAIAIDPEENPEKRLETSIFREKAAWMLENRENYFILDFDGE